MFCVTTLFVSSLGVGSGHNWIFSPNRNHLKNKVNFGDVKVDVEGDLDVKVESVNSNVNEKKLVFSKNKRVRNATSSMNVIYLVTRVAKVLCIGVK
jgi:hypothetical protein